jgi:subtilisin-like proprotein convertase family protein
LAAESCLPGNGAPDPDETVTVSFPLSNIGTGNTTNLVATLLPGGGVLAPSGPQSYGVTVPGGPPVAQPFTFTVAGMCGGDLTATLALQDGELALGTVTFTMRVGATAVATTSFSNTAPILIPGTGTGASTGAPADIYPSTVSVSGITGTVSKVTVDLTNFNHTFPGDVDVLLAGPGGQKILLMSDAGGGTDAVNVNLTFDDAAAAIGATVVSGTFRPTNIGTGDLFPAPAPVGPYPDPQLLSVFNGLDPNGTWSLYAVDDAGADVGNINGGWSLNITTSDPVCCLSACVLTAPANITVTAAPGETGAIVDYPAPAFTGSCGVVTSDPPSGSFFPIGTTTVTVTGTRQDGTVTATTFTVTVNPPPVERKVLGAGAFLRGFFPSFFEFVVIPKQNGEVVGQILYVETRLTGLVTLASASIQTLTINGDTAVFTGKGHLNGKANYTFRVTAVDRGHDKFGLQVTDPTGKVVKDLKFDPITLLLGAIEIKEQSSLQAATR